MNMLQQQSKTAYGDMQMSVANTSAMPVYSSMAAYTPQVGAPMHSAMHPQMYSGKPIYPYLYHEFGVSLSHILFFVFHF